MRHINDIINELKSHPDYLGSDIMTKPYLREKLEEENDGDLNEQDFDTFFNEYEPQLKNDVKSFYQNLYNHIEFSPFNKACESMIDFTNNLAD